MHKIQTDNWQMEVPEEWLVEQEDESILISDPDGVGELQITSLTKEDGDITEADLKEFIVEQLSSELDSVEVKLSGMAGYLFKYEEEGMFLREWFLRRKSFLFYISYVCEIENKDLDIKVIDEILETTEFVN